MLENYRRKFKSMRHKVKETLSTHNFYRDTGFDVDYDTYHPCHHGSDCCDNDYCRCGEIQNVRIKSIGDISPWFKAKTEMEKYVVDRIISRFDLKDISYWDARTTGGYYGEEFDGLYLRKDAAKMIEGAINKIIHLSNNDKIEQLLIEEYGYLLTDVENKIWTIQNINKSKLIIGNKEYRHKVNKEIVESYKEYNLPRAVCLSERGKYRLIDGYHRIAANTDDEIKIIVGK